MDALNTQHHLTVIETGIDRAIEISGIPQISKRLFEIFFDTYPETQQYFKDTDITTFSPRKFEFIREFLLDVMKHPDYFEGVVINEVVRHQAYGLRDHEYYNTLIDSFQLSIKESLSEEWNDDMETCWVDITTGMKANIFEASKNYL